MDLWLLLVLMSVATYRITRLVTTDTLPPALWVRDRLAGGWREAEDHETPTDVIDGVPSVYNKRAGWSPYWVGKLITCNWCASAYVAAGVVGTVWVVDGLPLPGLLWVSVWGAGALLAAQDWA